MVWFTEKLSFTFKELSNIPEIALILLVSIVVVEVPTVIKLITLKSKIEARPLTLKSWTIILLPTVKLLETLAILSTCNVLILTSLKEAELLTLKSCNINWLAISKDSTFSELTLKSFTLMSLK